MAQIVKVRTKTTKRTLKQNQGKKQNVPEGMQACNMCGGKGYHKKASK